MTHLSPARQPGVLLHSEITGSGPPLVVLHGLFGSHANWRPVARLWQDSFTVHTLDLRNHGRSPHSPVFDYPAMAADLALYLEQHELDSVHLLGHSLGGKAAMEFALEFPHCVTGLVVVDMAPRRYEPRQATAVAALQAVDAAHFSTRRELDQALTPHLPDAALRQFLMTNAVAGLDGRLQWRVNVAAIAANYPLLNDDIPAAGVFNRPALFVRGGKSDYIRDRDMNAIQARFPQAQMATIESAGHWVQADAPGELAELVGAFLGG